MAQTTDSIHIPRSLPLADGAPGEARGVSGFMRLPDVLRVFPVSKTSWWRGIQAGIYPKPYRLGERSSAWAVDDIKRLIAETLEKGARG